MAVKLPRVPEKVEQQHIVQLLRTIGGRVWVLGTKRRRNDFHGTMQTPGVPDVLAFLPVRAEPGRFVFVWIECKARGGRLRPEQAQFQALCDAAAVAHVVGDLDTVIAWLVLHGHVQADQFPHYRQPQTGAATP